MEYTPWAHSSRLIIVTWWIFNVMVFTLYTANLTAYLGSKRLEPIIDSLEDLNHQDIDLYFISENSVLNTFFRVSKI